MGLSGPLIAELILNTALNPHFPCIPARGHLSWREVGGFGTPRKSFGGGGALHGLRSRKGARGLGVCAALAKMGYRTSELRPVRARARAKKTDL